MENIQNDIDSRLIDYAPEYEGIEDNQGEADGPRESQGF